MSDFYAGKPRHVQLMDPADDPEEFIASSIYWYPSLFPTRTEVLEHTLLRNGNGYEWGADGNIRSVFSHIPPHPSEDTIVRHERGMREYEARGEHFQFMVEHYRDGIRAYSAVRADYRNRARTYGPVRLTENWPPGQGVQQRRITSADLKWTLLGRVPPDVTPQWRAVIAETLELFKPLFTEQGTLF